MGASGLGLSLTELEAPDGHCLHQPSPHQSLQTKSPGPGPKYCAQGPQRDRQSHTPDSEADPARKYAIEALASLLEVTQHIRSAGDQRVAILAQRGLRVEVEHEVGVG